jgi:hypothetical protein
MNSVPKPCTELAGACQLHLNYPRLLTGFASPGTLTGRGEPLAQEVGGILVKGGRCIALPNLYQHQFKPFHLEDPTKPGVQKVIAVFLCDPHIERISTSRVSPQQKEWIRCAMCNPAEGSLFRKLPRELLDMIVENVDGLLSKKEADKFREDLMRERGLFLNQHATEFFGVVRSFPFSDHSIG